MRQLLIAVALASACASGCNSSAEEQAVAAMRESLAAAQERDLDGAKAAAERASALRPGFVDPLMMLARIAEERGDCDEARRLYTEVLVLDPTSSGAGVAIALTFVREQRFDEARNWLDKSIESDPGCEPAAYNHGSLAEQQADLERAVAWFDVASALDPRDPRAPCRIASIRLLQQRPQDALAAAESALRRSPRSAAALALRARALQALGRD